MSQVESYYHALDVLLQAYSPIHGEIGQLQALVELSISRNALTALPDSIGLFDD